MFGQTIETIMRKVEGATAALVVGMDGFVIEQQCVPDHALSIEAIAAETASLIREAEASSQDLGLGALTETNLKTDRYYLLTQRITPDYFICLVISVDGNFGRARFELRKARTLLEKEFVI
jgi:predicted regulator of Ras-like GTPase activity (Roadblock/LC7/MglB family)